MTINGSTINRRLRKAKGRRAGRPFVFELDGCYWFEGVCVTAVSAFTWPFPYHEL